MTLLILVTTEIDKLIKYPIIDFPKKKNVNLKIKYIINIL